MLQAISIPLSPRRPTMSTSSTTRSSSTSSYGRTPRAGLSSAALRDMPTSGDSLSVEQRRGIHRPMPVTTARPRTPSSLRARAGGRATPSPCLPDAMIMHSFALVSDARAVPGWCWVTSGDSLTMRNNATITEGGVRIQALLGPAREACKSAGACVPCSAQLRSSPIASGRKAVLLRRRVCGNSSATWRAPATSRARTRTSRGGSAAR